MERSELQELLCQFANLSAEVSPLHAIAKNISMLMATLLVSPTLILKSHQVPGHRSGCSCAEGAAISLVVTGTDATMLTSLKGLPARASPWRPKRGFNWQATVPFFFVAWAFLIISIKVYHWLAATVRVYGRVRTRVWSRAYACTVAGKHIKLQLRN